jgi:hypothetical protein
MTRLSNDTDEVSIFALLNKDLSANDAIAVRTTGGVYDTEREYLFLGEFASQPKEHVVSDNFPYAAIELNEMWDIKSGTATSLNSFPEQCILHPHWSAAVKVRVGYESESAESYRTIGVVSDFAAGDIVTSQSLLTEEETIC